MKENEIKNDVNQEMRNEMKKEIDDKKNKYNENKRFKAYQIIVAIYILIYITCIHFLNDLLNFFKFKKSKDGDSFAKIMNCVKLIIYIYAFILPFFLLINVGINQDTINKILKVMIIILYIILPMSIICLLGYDSYKNEKIKKYIYLPVIILMLVLIIFPLKFGFMKYDETLSIFIHYIFILSLIILFSKSIHSFLHIIKGNNIYDFDFDMKLGINDSINKQNCGDRLSKDLSSGGKYGNYSNLSKFLIIFYKKWKMWLGFAIAFALLTVIDNLNVANLKINNKNLKGYNMTLKNWKNMALSLTVFGVLAYILHIAKYMKHFIDVSKITNTTNWGQNKMTILMTFLFIVGIIIFYSYERSLINNELNYWLLLIPLCLTVVPILYAFSEQIKNIVENIFKFDVFQQIVMGFIMLLLGLLIFGTSNNSATQLFTFILVFNVLYCGFVVYKYFENGNKIINYFMKSFILMSAINAFLIFTYSNL